MYVAPYGAQTVKEVQECVETGVVQALPSILKQHEAAEKKQKRRKNEKIV